MGSETKELSLVEQTRILWAKRIVAEIDLEILAETCLDDKDLKIDTFALKDYHSKPPVVGVCLRLMWPAAEGINQAVFIEITHQGQITLVGDRVNNLSLMVGDNWGTEQEKIFDQMLITAASQPYTEIGGRWEGDSFYYPLSSIRL